VVIVDAKELQEVKSELDKSIKSIKCLKYEVKKLKSQIQELHEEHKEEPVKEEPNDIIERNVTLTQEEPIVDSKELEEVKSELDKSIKSIKCLKYEVKKIKSITNIYNQQNTIINNNNTPNSEQLFQNLKDYIDDKKRTNSKIRDFAKLRYQIISKYDEEFDKMIKSNETIKLKLKPSNKICTTPYLNNPIRDDDSYSDINNSDYANSYRNFLNESKKNTNFHSQNTPPISNIKDYTPLFKINHINQRNNRNNINNNMNNNISNINSMNYYSTKNGQFNDFDYNNNSRIENNKRSIMNQRMQTYNSPQSVGYKLGNIRY